MTDQIWHIILIAYFTGLPITACATAVYSEILRRRGEIQTDPIIMVAVLWPVFVFLYSLYGLYIMINPAYTALVNKVADRFEHPGPLGSKDSSDHLLLRPSDTPSGPPPPPEDTNPNR